MPCEFSDSANENFCAFLTVSVSGSLTSDVNPSSCDRTLSARVKIVWGVLVSGIAISLLLAGGLKAVQTATIVFALPFALVIVLMAVALWRGVRDDWAEENRRERALRRRMREMVDTPKV